MTNETVMTDITKKTGAENIRWDLSDLFSSYRDPNINFILEEGEKKASAFLEQYKGKCKTLSPSQLERAFHEIETIWTPVYKVSQYIHLLYSLDTGNDDIKALVDKVDEAESTLSNLMVFFHLELAKMPKTAFQRFENNPDLKTYAYTLSRIRKTAKYTLSEKEEKVITLKDLTGINAFQKLYSDLTSGFQFECELDGVKKIMNGSELRALRYHPKPEVRRSAMKLFFSRYEENELIIGHIFNAIIKNCGIERKTRGYLTPISVRNTENDLEEASVKALHEVTTGSYPLVRRYYKMKAKLLDLPDFTLADIYAPMPDSTLFFPWDEAKNSVLKAFRVFDEDFYNMARIMFEEKRIDAPVSPKKRGGAFCSSSTPDIKPYVLLNFLGKQRDVSTLAHELGHALHAMLSSNQTLSHFHACLPLAETASVFSEMLVTDVLLKEVKDKRAKQTLLTEKLEDIFATSHRQNMFSRFESGVHDQIEKERMSTKALCHAYDSELKLMFGDSVNYTSEYRWEWASIPHIFEAPFYVYAYNFGNLLVLALYQHYLNYGKAFVPKLKAMLSLGSSASPRQITSVAGIDITKAAFWEGSIQYIKQLVDQLEALIGPRSEG